MYAKLENGVLKYAPKKVIYNGKIIFNPSEEILTSLGYMQIVKTECPYDGNYTSTYEVKNGKIVQVWIDQEIEYWATVSYDDAVNAEIRKRYSESQEFSILRQKDEKPEEYEEYYQYCEQCKEFVKTKKGIE